MALTSHATEVTNTTNVTISETGTATWTLLEDKDFNVRQNVDVSPTLAAETMVYSPWGSYAVVTLVCVFFVVGLFGNGITLVATLKSETRFKPHNILIMSLAVADAFSLLSTTFGFREFGEVSLVDMMALKSMNNFACKLFNAGYRTSLFNSTLMIMLICIERFIVVWFPLKSRHFMSKRLTIMSVAACVVATLAIVAIPSAVYSGIKNGTCFFDLDVNGDGETDTIKTTPLLLVIPVLFIFAPMLIILSLTPLTIVKLYRQHTIRRGLTSQELSTGPHRTSVLLTAVVVVFILLSVIPQLAFAAVSAGGTNLSTSTGPWVTFARTCLSVMAQANYSTNIVLYTWFNAEFRQNLFSMLGCSCC